ncbi:hypothetical protein G3O00_38970 [Burkholderia sp. Ac-20384]|uniref:hypothetical protein n=1 Tax=Burkholderia sp. Ac-20384 TaxID=2703902 RepID=UPI00197F69ED|nr:hypothetical protein [Burkholderia sp. Ac-20384]MBN3829533.1 hypothetical protein [Burkholderia sp. Ac-20384]
MTADTGKTTRAPKSLDDEITRAEQKLKRLQEQKRTNERKALERNERAIFDVLKAEKLNEVPAENWKAGIAAIRRALGVSPPAPSSPPAAAAVAAESKPGA